MDAVLRYYNNQKRIADFGNVRLVLLDGNLGSWGEYHGPVYALIDEDNQKTTVTRDLNDCLMLKDRV